MTLIIKLKIYFLKMKAQITPKYLKSLHFNYLTNQLQGLMVIKYLEFSQAGKALNLKMTCLKNQAFRQKLVSCMQLLTNLNLLMLNKSCQQLKRLIRLRLRMTDIKMRFSKLWMQLPVKTKIQIAKHQASIYLILTQTKNDY